MREIRFKIYINGVNGNFFLDNLQLVKRLMMTGV